MRKHKIECITLWKESAEFRIKRRNLTTGEVEITITNRLNKAETEFISKFVTPYCDCWILQWNEADLEE